MGGRPVSTHPADYQVTENLFLSAGYRHMSFDDRDGGKRLDIDMSGAIIGATWCI